MPRRCCVPGCETNSGNKQDATTFKFPSGDRRSVWVKAIHRKDFEPTNSSAVCIQHFHEKDIIREDVLKRADGSTLVVKKTRPVLTNDAVPAIFKGQPAYMSSKPVIERLGIERRQQATERRKQEALDQLIAKDVFDYDGLIASCREKIDAKKWVVSECADNVLFMKVNHLGSCKPKLVVAVKIWKNLQVQIFHDDIEIRSAKFRWILSRDLQCNRWTMLATLLDHLFQLNSTQPSVTDKLSYISGLLDEVMEENNGHSNSKITHIKEQIKLLCGHRNRYSADWLIFASSLYYRNSSAYRFVRETGCLTLPHPSYIRKLSSMAKTHEPGVKHSHEFYLKERLAGLNEEEKVVNLLLDKIHIKPSVENKGCKTEGICKNSFEVVNTLQVFMVSSLQTSYTDIVALFPVTNIVATDLEQHTLDVLRMLHLVGFRVVSVIADNGENNREMFEQFCGGALQTSISHPFEEGSKLFFYFNTVHLLECIRNDWLNQKSSTQTFIVPSFDNFTETQCSSLKSIKELSSDGQNDCAKSAAKLSQNVVFPLNFERPAVQDALKLFSKKSIEALSLHDSENSGTVNFITTIRAWWNIINVKSFGEQSKVPGETSPVFQGDRSNLKFLEKFCSWLEAWEAIENTDFPHDLRRGKLSSETSFALLHTSNALIERSKYLLEESGLQNALQGKFKTDQFESHNGLQHRVSDCIYNVTIAQVLESRKKLEICNLLELKCSFGEFQISVLSFDGNTSDDITPEMNEMLKIFPSLFDSVTTSTITTNDASALIYIAAFVSYSVGGRLSCSICSCRLSIANNMHYELPNDACEYMSLLSREDLKWPTEFTVALCSNTFMIFKEILLNHEHTFLSCANLQTTLTNLAYTFSMKTLDGDEICTCSRPVSALVALCARIMANILLNNYTQAKNDATSSGKKRKLSAVN